MIQFQGAAKQKYEGSGLSVLFEQMSPAEVQALIVEAASARLHRIDGKPRRRARGE